MNKGLDLRRLADVPPDGVPPDYGMGLQQVRLFEHTVGARADGERLAGLIAIVVDIEHCLLRIVWVRYHNLRHHVACMEFLVILVHDVVSKVFVVLLLVVAAFKGRSQDARLFLELLVLFGLVLQKPDVDHVLEGLLQINHDIRIDILLFLSDNDRGVSDSALVQAELKFLILADNSPLDSGNALLQELDVTDSLLHRLDLGALLLGENIPALSSDNPLFPVLIDKIKALALLEGQIGLGLRGILR